MTVTNNAHGVVAQAGTVPDPNVTKTLADILVTGNDLEKCLAAQTIGRIHPGVASDALIAALRDPDEDVRIDAAAAIRALSIDEAAPVLVDNIVEDPSPDCKIAYIEAAGQFRASEAVPVLRALVRGPAEEEIAWDTGELAQSECIDWLDVQIKAVETLGKIGAEEAVSDIHAALEDEFGQDLLQPGLKALANMGTAGLNIVMTYLKSKDVRHRRSAIQILSAAPRASLKDVEDDLLCDHDPTVRLMALGTLAETDDRLENFLQDKNAAVRTAAAVRLVKQQPTRLEGLLNDSNEQVRISALEQFLELDDQPDLSGVGSILLDWLEGDSPSLAVTAANALPKIAPADAANPVRRIALRRGAAVEVRRASISALVALLPDNAIDTLIMIAQDPLRAIRLEAIGGLARIAKKNAGDKSEQALTVLITAIAGSLVPPPEDEPSNISEDEDSLPSDENAQAGRSHGVRAAKEDDAMRVNRIRIDEEGNIVPTEPHANDFGNSASQDLENDLTEAQDNVSAFPVSTLEVLQGGVCDSTEHAQALDVQLTSEDLGFLELTGMSKSKESHPEHFIAAHMDVRVLAARTLADVSERRVIESLVAVLDDTNDELRVAAAMSLEKLAKSRELVDEDSALKIGTHLGDKNPTLRLWLTRVAATAGLADLSDQLHERLKDDDESVRAEAVIGLSQSDTSFDASSFLEDDSPIVRKSAGQALLNRHGAGAYRALLKMAFDHEGADRFEAARLLRSADQTAANTALIEKLTTSNSALDRRIAIEVLGAINGMTNTAS